MAPCSSASKRTVKSHNAGAANSSTGQLAIVPQISLTNLRRFIATPRLKIRSYAQNYPTVTGPRTVPMSALGPLAFRLTVRNPASRRTPIVRHGFRRVGSAWLAQETEDLTPIFLTL